MIRVAIDIGRKKRVVLGVGNDVHIPSATNEVPFSYLSTNSYYFIKIVPFCFPFQFKVLFLRYLAI